MDKDKELIEYLNKKINSKLDYLDFDGVNMDYSTHKYHNYPATMIPKLPELFIEAVQSVENIDGLYDPFMGSGTTLVEGIRHGVTSTGVDLNPLAVLISKVKTKKLSTSKLNNIFNDICDYYQEQLKEVENNSIQLNLPDFKRIEYWFKPYVIRDLQILKNKIITIKEEEYRNFFLLTFSSTVRYVSNTRNNEFKMYRMASNTLEKWNPNVFETFNKFTIENIERNSKLIDPNAEATPIFGTSQSLKNVPDNSYDLLITSPPYGDSKTTVAYGQFSRTSLQWLDLKEYPADKVPKIDRTLLGGKLINKEIKKSLSPTLNKIIRLIDKKDHKRALEVLQFYIDLYSVLEETARVMKPGSYQFWVTANRTVKGYQLPTDQIITELYESLGTTKLAHYERNIPNKRMPGKNSPTNEKGKKVSTMHKENIVVYKTGKNIN